MRVLLDANLLVLSDTGGELLQSLVHQRYKLKRSTVVNRAGLGQVPQRQPQCDANLGRLMHRAHLLEFEGQAVRVRACLGLVAQPSLSSPPR